MSNAGRNGVILLGYARSAGSGDQAVPGVVTSRRDRGQKQLQEKKKLAQQEEERKLRARQEQAAQFLKKKWKQEEKRRKKGTDRENDSEDEADTRAPVESEGNPPAQVPVQEGKWVSKEEENLKFLQDNARPRELSRGGMAPASASASAGVVGKEAPVKVDTESQKNRKKALANAFGMDDDEDEARRELELAARVKRQRVDSRGPPHDTGAAIGGAPAVGAPSLSGGGSNPMDMYEQLRKLAEWKRACKGNRRPMPDDMVAAIAATAGIQNDEPQQKPSSSSRRRSPSRSRSRGRRRDSRR